MKINTAMQGYTGGLVCCIYFVGQKPREKKMSFQEIKNRIVKLKK